MSKRPLSEAPSTLSAPEKRSKKAEDSKKKENPTADKKNKATRNNGSYGSSSKKIEKSTKPAQVTHVSNISTTAISQYDQASTRSSVSELNLATVPTTPSAAAPAATRPKPAKLRMQQSELILDSDEIAGAALYDRLWLEGDDLLNKLQLPVPSDVKIPYGDLWDLEATKFRKKRPYPSAFSTKILELFDGTSEVRLERILHSKNNRILVTQDYQELYKTLSDHDANWLENSRTSKPGNTLDPRHCIVFGNPGIGKSVFLDYVLVRRLLMGQDTFFITADQTFAYTSLGLGVGKNLLREFTKIRSEASLLGQDCWILYDSVVPEKPGLITMKYIQATSPDVDKYMTWRKYSNALIFHLDLWAWPEFYLLSTSLLYRERSGFSHEDFALRLWYIYQKYGAEPRLIQSLRCTARASI
ncbi:hypothetical protein BJ508DRAFT_133641 [Ascobolus immersus RN42]|uniref:Uncharacterized protein n=1 Tax=Ascobolus immersus RN42 TaxID=1160509 RepID=A0A3N4IJU5_ASCIM|nr:hypothetical protein BJ508DRAFT_133641 [Ascobolus immersus RN42]